MTCWTVGCLLSPSERFDHILTQAIRLPAKEREDFVHKQLSGEASACETVLRMLRNLDRMSGFLTGPANLSAPPEIPAGTLIANRFRIVKFLAHGGMGAVYEAEDIELTLSGTGGDPERVALKFVRADLPDDPWLSKQFYAELALGRKVAHARICRLYDVHKHEWPDGRKQLCFSMQLLDGATLAARMSGRGPWTQEEAWPVLEAIAEGLEAAHAAGIVHRDLKPGNILLTANGPVITDFGLALADPKTGAPHFSSPAGVLGTLPYMAPEQFTEGRITTAADIFAFGVIAYELAAGKPPFPSDSAESAVSARLSGDYSTPPYWRETIAACLRPSPQDRPKNVREALEMMAPRIAAGQFGRRKLLAWSAVASAASVTGVVGYRYAKGTAERKGLLLVKPIGEIEPDEATALHDLLRSHLDQSKQFELLTADRVEQILTRMGQSKADLSSNVKTAREVALREAAPFVVFPTVNRDKSLTIKLERMGGYPSIPAKQWSEEFPARSTTELVAAAAKASDWVRRTTGESQQDVAANSHRPEEVSTGSWEALMAYTKAEQARAAGDDNEAIRQLKIALEHDPDFPSANMRLGDILMGQGQTHMSWSLQRKATALVLQRRLTDRESFRIRGMFLLDSDDVVHAEPIFEQWASAYPRDYLPAFYLSTCRRRMGRLTDAASAIEETLRRAPGNPWAIMLRAQIRMHRRDLAAARRDLDQVREINAWWWRYEAEYRFLSLELPGVERSLNGLSGLGPEHRSTSILLRAYLWADCGDVPSAMAELRRGIAFDSSLERLATHQTTKWIALGAMAATNGYTAIAREAAHHATAHKADLVAALNTAMILFRSGAIAEGDSIIRSIPEIPDAPAYRALRFRAAGHRAMAYQDYRKAITAFTEAGKNRIAIEPSDELAAAFDAAGQLATAKPLWASTLWGATQYWLGTEMVWPGVHRRALLRLSSDPAARARLQSLDRGLIG